MITVGLIQLVILVFALLRSKGLAVMLGPEGVGIIGAMDQLVVTVTQISAFGIPFTAMKFMSAAHSTDQQAFRSCFARRRSSFWLSPSFSNPLRRASFPFGSDPDVRR